jgi:hypothetical protein
MDSIAELPQARILGTHGGGGRPPKPTRDQILALMKTSGMQGMTVPMTQEGKGVVPIAFTDGLLTSALFTKEDRLRAYAEKRRLGDTHVILNVSWRYDEPGLTYQVPGRDLSKDLPTFREYVEEALDQGFYVVVMLAGDGRSKPKNPDGSYPYNDPVGWTYGREWLLANFERIYSSLRDLSPWIVWSAGYDGCIPEWGDHGEVDEWTLHARDVIGADGYLMQHFSAGYCWWGGSEGNNFVTPGGLALDLATTCMPVPMNCPDVRPDNWASLNDEQKKPWTQVWQVAGRLTKDWKPQPDQVSTGDDLHPPYLLMQTSRGPQRHCVLEICTYDWVRGRIDLDGVNRRRHYLRDAGVQLMG